jgi:glutathione S-transferase
MASKTLYDSTIINEFLNEKFKSKVGLYPEDSYDRAIMRLSIDHINKSVVPAFFRLLQAQPDQPQKQHSALKEFRDALEDVAKKAQGPYFLGEQFSLVDAAIAP